MFHCSNHLEWFEIRLLVGYCNPYMFGRRNSNHYIVLGSIPSSGSRILLVYIYIYSPSYISLYFHPLQSFFHIIIAIYISLPKPLFFNSIFPVQCAKKHSNCSFLNSHEPGHFSSSANQLGQNQRCHSFKVRLLRFFKPLYLLVAGIMVSLKTAVGSKIYGWHDSFHSTFVGFLSKIPLLFLEYP